VWVVHHCAQWLTAMDKSVAPIIGHVQWKLGLTTERQLRVPCIASAGLRHPLQVQASARLGPRARCSSNMHVLQPYVSLPHFPRMSEPKNTAYKYAQIGPLKPAHAMIAVTACIHCSLLLNMCRQHHSEPSHCLRASQGEGHHAADHPATQPAACSTSLPSLHPGWHLPHHTMQQQHNQ
jgi:hypothetical protein